jgi:hypothetical protein
MMLISVKFRAVHICLVFHPVLCWGGGGKACGVLSCFCLDFVWISDISLPIPVAARIKAWLCGHSLTGIAGSNPTGGMDVCLLCVLCVIR